MITSRIILLLLLYISCSIHAMAQTDFYYYNGKKIPLTLNENKVCLSIHKDCSETSKRIFANVQVLVTIKDTDYDIFVIPQSDYEKLTSLDSWEDDTKSVILTSCYFTASNEEAVATPYLNVKLKKEQDIDLLTSYAEKYRLKIVNKSPFTLWYVLAINPDSDKKTVECANELWESGDFASSVPDLSPITSEATTIRLNSMSSTEESSLIYDLHGRKLTTRPTDGIYILRGQKVMAKSWGQ